MAATYPWLRLWVDMPNDPKWRTIAKVSQHSISEVVAVYLHMLSCAANGPQRGCIQTFENEDVASALDLPVEGVAAIRAAMQGRVLDGECLTGWNRRQPLKEDGSAERAKEWRESQKDKSNETERDRTKPNVTERKKREEKEEEDKTRLPPPGGGGVPGVAEDELTGDLFQHIDPPRRPKPEDPPPCPHQDIIALYHEVLPMCPRVRIWTDARKELLRTRWKEDPERQDLAFWRRFFHFVAESKLLTGRKKDKPFLVDLEWIVRPSNFVKIYEGKYRDE